MTVKNLLDEYMTQGEISNTQMSKLLSVSYTTVYNYRQGNICPGLDHARKIHHVTKGQVPVSFWGYELVKGKFVKTAKQYSSKLANARYVPNQGD